MATVLSDVEIEEAEDILLDFPRECRLMLIDDGKGGEKRRRRAK